MIVRNAKGSIGSFVKRADRAERERLDRLLCQESLIDFIRAVSPWFVIEEVHLQLCEELEAMVAGEFDRLMIFEPPRAGKSTLISSLFPAWYLGRNPADKVMQVSYKVELALKFGRSVRDLLQRAVYQRIFPGVYLRPDVKAAGYWKIQHTKAGEQEGEYFAAGVTGGIAGQGWNLGIVDDPLSEQDAASDVAKQFVREDWYAPGFYTRRQPESNMAVIMSTRWASDDLPGHLLTLQDSDPEADKWRVVEVPALLTGKAAETLNRYSDMAHFYDQIRARQKGKKQVWIPAEPIAYREGDSFAPRRFSKAELQRTKANMRPARFWNALYMQRPVDDEGHILKREFWKKWEHKEPPACFEVIDFYDTAFEEDEEADFSARTTWGLFQHGYVTNAILIGAWWDKVDFAALLHEIERRQKDKTLSPPDRIYIEKRATGGPLVKEARKRGLPARAWLPPKGLPAKAKGKVPRAHMASFVLEEGAVWYVDRRWAQDVIDQCAAFPFGSNDDLVDTVTMALIHLRERWKLEIHGVDDVDEKDEDDDFKPVVQLRRAYA